MRFFQKYSHASGISGGIGFRNFQWGNKKSKFENIDARIDDKACIERLNVRKKNRMKNFVIQFDFNFLETIETNKVFRKFNSIDY